MNLRHPVLADRGRFHVAKLRHNCAASVEHPRHIANNSLPDDHLGQLDRVGSISNEQCNEEMTEIWAGALTPRAINATLESRIDLGGDGRAIRGEDHKKMVNILARRL